MKSRPHDRWGDPDLPAWAPRLLALLMPLALTWPTLVQPGQAALGSPRTDTVKNLWTLWWMRQEGWRPAPGRHTSLVNWPEGMVLQPIEPLNGLLDALLPFSDLVVTHNVLVIINLALLGLAAGWLALVVTGRRLSAAVATLLVQGSSTTALMVGVGAGELLHLWWIPLGLGAWWRAEQTLDARWFLLIGLTLVGAGLTSPSLCIVLAIGLLLLAVPGLLHRPRHPRLWLGALVTAVLAAAILFPIATQFAQSFQTGTRPEIPLWTHLLHGDPTRSLETPENRLAISELLLPAPLASPYQGGRFLGLSLLFLAATGLGRTPSVGWRWAVVAVGGVVLAMGSVTVLGGHTLPLPFLQVQRFTGWLGEPMHFPTRNLLLTTLGLSVMAACAVRAGPLRRVMALMGLVAVIEVGLLSPEGWPWPRTPARPTAHLAQLIGETEGAVLDLTLAFHLDQHAQNNAIFSQVTHGRPIQQVPLDRLWRTAPEGHQLVMDLPLVQAWRDVANGVSATAHVDFPEHDLADLRRAGFVVLIASHRDGRETLPASLQSALVDELGPPITLEDGLGAWRIPAPRP